MNLRRNAFLKLDYFITSFLCYEPEWGNVGEALGSGCGDPGGGVSGSKIGQGGSCGAVGRAVNSGGTDSV